MSEDMLKVVVFGALNAGKTTFVEKLSGQKLFLKGEYENITTSFDFVQMEQGNFLIHLFASPGHRRFSFMWDTLATGMDGAILLIDSTVGITPVDHELIKFILNYDVPYVIAVNKNDICSLEPTNVRKELDISDEIPVINTSAIINQNLVNVLDSLIQTIAEKNIV
ncbi:MAG: GTP-binding protein [Methanobacteriaceae archaeon]|jgi:small GTP-binding protein|nr:GTP-binding protein [Methanobacteriaceae archaeon]OPY20388.1 MAG: putative translation initiation factor IF-2 [Methanobacterium sp. PtaU1.Bin097]